MPQQRGDWFAVVEATEAGDRKALLKLTRVITGLLARCGAYEMRDQWDDLTQEILITLIKSVRSGAIREREAFVNYAARITRNKFVDFVRASKKPGSADGARDLETADGEGAIDPHRGESRPPDELLDLETSLEGLDERERAVITAVYVEGRSYQEAADRLGVPLGTLKRLQTGALRILRERMGVAKKTDPKSRGLRPTIEPGPVAGRGGGQP